MSLLTLTVRPPLSHFLLLVSSLPVFLSLSFFLFFFLVVGRRKRLVEIAHLEARATAFEINESATPENFSASSSEASGFGSYQIV